MAYSFNKTFEGAFRLNPENVARFMELIRQVCGTSARARVGFDDDVDITYEDAGIPEKEKARYSRIKRVNLSSVEIFPQNKLELVFRRTIDSGSVSVELNGDVDHCERFQRSIVAEVEKMRCPYNWFYRSANPFRRSFVLIFQCLTLSALYFYLLAGIIGAFHPTERTWSFIAWIFLSVVAIASMVTLFVISRLAFIFYSPMIFDFGKGSDDQRNIEKRRTAFWGLIASPIIIALATPPFVNWLYSSPAQTSSNKPTVESRPADPPNTATSTPSVIPSAPPSSR